MQMRGKEEEEKDVRRRRSRQTPPNFRWPLPVLSSAATWGWISLEAEQGLDPHPTHRNALTRPSQHWDSLGGPPG